MEDKRTQTPFKIGDYVTSEKWVKNTFGIILNIYENIEYSENKISNEFSFKILTISCSNGNLERNIYNGYNLTNPPGLKTIEIKNLQSIFQEFLDKNALGHLKIFIADTRENV